MYEERIIVINDCDEGANATCHQLRIAGFKNIAPFSNSKNALEAIGRIEPHLIISDINMPGIDGWQFCKILNSPEYKKFHHVPIILLSGTYKDTNAQQLAYDVGASDFLQAPYNYEDLLILVFTYLVSGKKPKKGGVAVFKKKMVIADDDENILKALTLILKDEGYEIETATDGKMAMEVIKRVKPQVVLLDYQMPEVDGLEVIKWLKVNFPDTGSIILTAHGSEVAAVKFMKEGADDYIRKPFEVQKIAEVCELAFKKYNLRIIDKQFKEKNLEKKISEKKYQGIVENSSDLIFIIDPDGNFSFVSKKSESFLGLKPEEIIGKPFIDVVFEEDKEKVQKEFLGKSMGDKERKEFEARLEIAGKETMDAGMETTVVEISAQDLYSEDASRNKVFLGILAVARDITERKKIQERLMQAEKLSSLGTLISGIAHELNNPLTGVLGYSEFLMDDPDISEANRHDIEKIFKEAQRCEKIVQNLLTFARKYKMEKGLIDINEVIENTIELVSYQLKTSTIKIHRELDKAAPMIFADFHQVQQVFLNILNNAIHALHDSNPKGNLWVKSHATPEKEIITTIKNEGSPIPEQVISNIFDPFFTTKGVGKGTGLGLSISHGIISDHGGTIGVENQPDGVVFTIKFPPASQSIDPTIKDEKITEELMEAKNILVVEDEEVIRDFLERILTKDGHKVVSVTNGAKALEILETEPFDLVVSDLKMPGMSGISLYNEMVIINPQMVNRFIIITGTIENEVSEFSKNTGNPYLQKPFRKSDLQKLLVDVFRVQE